MEFSKQKKVLIFQKFSILILNFVHSQTTGNLHNHCPPEGTNFYCIDYSIVADGQFFIKNSCTCIYGEMCMLMYRLSTLS